MAASHLKVAVVTGSNKGIGLEIVKGLARTFKGVIYLTAVGSERSQKPSDQNINVGFHQLDIDSTESISRFATFIKEKHQGLDLLVNNAAINYMHEDSDLSVGEQAENVIRVNFTGTLNVCRALFPLLNPDARVVNVSSRMGLLRVLKDENIRKKFADESLTVDELCQVMRVYVSAAKQGKHESICECSYSMSKVGLNALTRIQQREFDRECASKNLIVNAVTPGYVATDMTKFKGTLTVEQGAETPLHLCFLSGNEPKGAFWADLRPMGFE